VPFKPITMNREGETSLNALRSAFEQKLISSEVYNKVRLLLINPSIESLVPTARELVNKLAEDGAEQSLQTYFVWAVVLLQSQGTQTLNEAIIGLIEMTKQAGLDMNKVKYSSIEKRLKAYFKIIGTKQAKDTEFGDFFVKIDEQKMLFDFKSSLATALMQYKFADKNVENKEAAAAREHTMKNNLEAIAAAIGTCAANTPLVEKVRIWTLENLSGRFPEAHLCLMSHMGCAKELNLSSWQNMPVSRASTMMQNLHTLHNGASDEKEESGTSFSTPRKPFKARAAPGAPIKAARAAPAGGPHGGPVQNLFNLLDSDEEEKESVEEEPVAEEKEEFYEPPKLFEKVRFSLPITDLQELCKQDRDAFTEAFILRSLCDGKKDVAGVSQRFKDLKISPDRTSTIIKTKGLGMLEMAKEDNGFAVMIFEAIKSFAEGK
jgi:hypothetical protein